MNINSIGAPNRLQGFNNLSSGGMGGQGAVNLNLGAGGIAGADQTSLSSEARGGSSKAQQYSNKFTQDTLGALQAQSSGDDKKGQQALKQLGNTYKQGQENGLLDGVNPAIKGLAEQLLGAGKGEQAGSGQCGGGKSGGCGGGKGGGAGEAQGGGGSSGGGCSRESDEKKFDKEVLDQLEKLLGKDKAEELKKESESKDGQKTKNSEEAAGAENSVKKDNSKPSNVTDKNDSKVKGIDSGRKSPRESNKSLGKPSGGGKKSSGGGQKPSGGGKKPSGGSKK